MFSTSNVEICLFKIFTTRNQTGPKKKKPNWLGIRPMNYIFRPNIFLPLLAPRLVFFGRSAPLRSPPSPPSNHPPSLSTPPRGRGDCGRRLRW